MFSSKFRLAYFTALLVLIQFPQTSRGKENRHCDPSSCGNIRNISYPFRLKGDPKHCGDPRYELACDHQNNITALQLYSQKYYVQAINYHNFTIRLLDPGMQRKNCSSLPQYSLSEYNFSFKDAYTIYKHKLEKLGPFPRGLPQITKPIIFLSCPYSVNSSLYRDDTAAACNNIHGGGGMDSTNSSLASSLGRHSYISVGRLNASDVRDLCSVDLISLTSLALKDGDYNLSFSEIHNALLFGFELSWFKCGNCTGFCYFDFDGNYQRCISGACSIFYTKNSPWCGILVLLKGIPMLCLRLGTLAIELHFAAKIIFGVPSTMIFLIIKLRRRHWSVFDNIEAYLRSQNNLTPIRYSYSEIKKMTKGFKDKLGEGGYGSVYKGKLRSGNLVAIKILGKSKSNGQEFVSEVATIGRIHHVNVVQLIGYCAERSKRALVYEFMPNGSLEKYLSPREEHDPLSWERKYEIALGVARGIEYLHRGCDMQILHFDIKPHNVLLDEKFIPKVSDFGLARLYPTDNSIVPLTAARGTIGYVAPELINRSIGGISYKADVYSFGMLLVEMVGLKNNLAETEGNSSQYFPDWIYDRFNKGKEIEIGDATENEGKIIRKMTLVALWCIQTNPADRPSMTKVVEMLEGEVELLQVPPEPLQSPQHTTVQDQTWTGESTESEALLCESSYSATADLVKD